MYRSVPGTTNLTGIKIRFTHIIGNTTAVSFLWNSILIALSGVLFKARLFRPILNTLLSIYRKNSSVFNIGFFIMGDDINSLSH